MNRLDIRKKKKINLHFFRTLVIKRPVPPHIPETYPEKLNRSEIISKFLIAERRIENEACLVKLILSRLIFVLLFPSPRLKFHVILLRSVIKKTISHPALQFATLVYLSRRANYYITIRKIRRNITLLLQRVNIFDHSYRRLINSFFRINERNGWKLVR